MLQKIRGEGAPPLPQSKAITDAEGTAMARAVVNLFNRWGLTDEQARTLLGDVSQTTYSRWKSGTIPRLKPDLKARLSNLMGIHKSLRILFTESGRAYQWIKSPNEAFGGRSALDVMLEGELTDLMRVRHYLDAARG